MQRRELEFGSVKRQAILAVFAATTFITAYQPAFAAEPPSAPTEMSLAEKSDAQEGEKTGEDHEQANVSAEQALQMLKAGNRRFVEGKPKHPHDTILWRQSLTKGQHPFATVLGCSDSRVSPELVFDEGLGDLFVIRVAGNIVDNDVTASIEYAVEHLHTHLIVVLGHKGCGAVTAAMHTGDKHPLELGQLIEKIHHRMWMHHKGEPDVFEGTSVDDAVVKNVLCAARQLRHRRSLGECMRGKDVQVVPAIYDLETGLVLWLEEGSSKTDTAK